MLIPLLRTHLRPYTGILIGVLVLQFTQVMASLYLPTLNADIIDKGVATGDTAYIWRTGGLMLAVSLAQGVFTVLATWLAARAAMGVGRDLRAEVFDRVGSFSEREISAFGAGSLITRNTNDVQQVQMLVMMSCTMLVTAPVMAVGGIIMAVTRAPSLSWLIAVSVPTLLIAVGLIVRRMVPLFRSYQDRLDAINRVLREQLTGIRVVRAFVREQAEAERFGGANHDIAWVGERVGRLFVLLFPLVLLILDITIVAVIWFGGHQVGDGTVEVGVLIAFMAYLMQILMGILMASFMTILIPRASVCAERISEVLGTVPAIASPATPTSPAVARGAVELAPGGRRHGGGGRAHRLHGLPRRRGRGPGGPQLHRPARLDDGDRGLDRLGQVHGGHPAGPPARRHRRPGAHRGHRRAPGRARGPVGPAGPGAPEALPLRRHRGLQPAPGPGGGHR